MLNAYARVFLSSAICHTQSRLMQKRHHWKLKNREIVEKPVAPPHGAERLLSLLNRYSLREK